MFGFPKVNRKEIGSFNKNFLRSVIFQVKFEDNPSFLEKRDEIASLFSNLLPRKQDRFERAVQISFKDDHTPILSPQSEKDSGFELRSADGQKVLSITSEAITYTIGGKVYVDFENFKSELKLIEQVLGLGTITHLNRVAIRKLNIIEFEIPQEYKATPMEIMSSFLNTELLASVSSLPQSSLGSIKQNINTINYVKDDHRLNLKYGLVVPSNQERSGHIVIDIDRFSVSTTETSKLLNVVEPINSDIFDIFNWALSEDSFKFLKGE
jgi:uncharacterized protein (TIGR04255 family)